MLTSSLCSRSMKNIGSLDRKVTGLLAHIRAGPKVRLPHNVLTSLSQLEPGVWQPMNLGEQFQGHSISSVRQEVRGPLNLAHTAREYDFPARS